jgi:hypothetical protein
VGALTGGCAPSGQGQRHPSRVSTRFPTPRDPAPRAAWRAWPCSRSRGAPDRGSPASGRGHVLHPSGRGIVAIAVTSSSSTLRLELRPDAHKRHCRWGKATDVSRVPNGRSCPDEASVTGQEFASCIGLATSPSGLDARTASLQARVLARRLARARGADARSRSPPTTDSSPVAQLEASRPGGRGPRRGARERGGLPT